MKSRKSQMELLKKEKSAYGGELLKTRQGRSTPRPLNSKRTMHLVLRSTQARGKFSFKRPKNDKKIMQIVDKFSNKYGVKILSLANVGNHLHFHIKLSNRHSYTPFIRAVTASIAMAVTGSSKNNPLKQRGQSSRVLDNGSKSKSNGRFWDYRPFTRVVTGLRAFLNLKDYIQINRLEGFGYKRGQARFLVKSKNSIKKPTGKLLDLTLCPT